MKKILAILTILSLSACATTQTGNKFDAEKAASFKVGKSTYNQVVQALGEPSSVSEGADGSKVIGYVYASAHSNGKGYIPIVGAFLGGVDGESHSATFAFNNKSILTNKSVSNMGGGTSNALTDASNKHSNQN